MSYITHEMPLSRYMKRRDLRMLDFIDIKHPFIGAYVKLIDSVPWSGVRGRAFASDICCLHVGYVSCHPLIFDSGCFGFRAGGTTGDLLPFEVGTSGDGPLISLLG